MLYTTGSKLRVADPGEWPGDPAPHLFLDQTETRRAEKFFLETAPPPPPLPLISRSGSGADYYLYLLAWLLTGPGERERTREAREQKVI